MREPAGRRRPPPARGVGSLRARRSRRPPGSSGRPDGEPVYGPGGVRSAWIIAAGTMASAVITATASLAIADLHPVPVAAPEPAAARIANTGGSGTFVYGGPGTGALPRVRGPAEGDLVGVTCQVRGRVVWDRLVDGWWIQDAWTDLPKDTGDVPPDGIAHC